MFQQTIVIKIMMEYNNLPQGICIRLSYRRDWNEHENRTFQDGKRRPRRRGAGSRGKRKKRCHRTVYIPRGAIHRHVRHLQDIREDQVAPGDY